MEPFIPPRFNLALHWTVDATFPVLIKAGLNLDSIEVSEEDRRRLRELRGERMILPINHPTTAEGAVAYFLGNQMGSRFHYMASREVFDWLGGMMGVVLQGLGVFSVLPGTEDRDAIRMARSLVAAPGGKLVVFPEGDYPTGLQNSLGRFESDAVHLAFRALKDLRRGQEEGEIYVVPTVVRHILSGSHQSVLNELESSMRRLESRFGAAMPDGSMLPDGALLAGTAIQTGSAVQAGGTVFSDVAMPGLSGSFSERLASLRLRLLALAEGENGRDALDVRDARGAQHEPADRVHRLAHDALDRVASRHHVQDYPSKDDIHAKLRFLLSVIERRRVDFPDPRLPEMTGDELNVASRDCRRASILLALGDACDTETAEGVMEHIRLMEEYVSGSSRPRSSRAVVRIGAVLRASEFLPAYERSRKIGLAELTERLRTEMQTLLDQTRVLCTRLV